VDEANAGEHAFDLSGGHLCLDFANTLSVQTGDHLRVYGDLVAWGRQAGALTLAQADRLLDAAARQPAAADAALARARRFRAAIYLLFAARAAGQEPATADLDALNAELARTLGKARIVRAADGFSWAWAAEDALDRVLWPVVRSAAELLTSDALPLVRECAASNCRWLFLDTTKNRSRQWCDMRVCGNRAKARRYHQRRRKAV